MLCIALSRYRMSLILKHDGADLCVICSKKIRGILFTSFSFENNKDTSVLLLDYYQYTLISQGPHADTMVWVINYSGNIKCPRPLKN